ncbi:SGNH/GDSL hydrolase family protein [Kribbella qitaiheensis]|uniref:SGNH/GDSL hydrolase family protein n=1 Tax=Kribbella qitaiheensis TaxID=1544730 RepID=A0A7G6WRZ9_9ACTN|nr:GDSL-type esterase/lipase family protein [Kribbella qitaiheensis]QNE16764.1 SGNH/GDSL hydrolase family protein [Kribbella qitaiheensis]
MVSTPRGSCSSLTSLVRPRARAVSGADVDLLTIGANDFGDHHDEIVEASCAKAGAGDCVSDELAQLSSDLRRILSRLRQLRADRPTTALVTGYWDVFEDGQVARQNFSADGIAATVDLTKRVNAVIAAATIAEGAMSVELSGPFQRAGDITKLLAPDGDHPDAAGHQLIAQVLLAAGLPTMRPRS